MITPPPPIYLKSCNKVYEINAWVKILNKYIINVQDFKKICKSEI